MTAGAVPPVLPGEARAVAAPAGAIRVPVRALTPVVVGNEPTPVAPG